MDENQHSVEGEGEEQRANAGTQERYETVGQGEFSTSHVDEEQRNDRKNEVRVCITSHFVSKKSTATKGPKR
jgi:hypothetical protein